MTKCKLREFLIINGNSYLVYMLSGAVQPGCVETDLSLSLSPSLSLPLSEISS